MKIIPIVRPGLTTGFTSSTRPSTDALTLRSNTKVPIIVFCSKTKPTLTDAWSFTDARSIAAWSVLVWLSISATKDTWAFKGSAGRSERLEGCIYSPDNVLVILACKEGISLSNSYWALSTVLTLPVLVW